MIPTILKLDKIKILFTIFIFIVKIKFFQIKIPLTEFQNK